MTIFFVLHFVLLYYYGSTNPGCADAHISSEIWYSENDTLLFHQKYLELYPKIQAHEKARVQHGFALCKGVRQRVTVSQACAVVGRSKGHPLMLIRGTQDEDITRELSSTQACVPCYVYGTFEECNCRRC